MIEPPSTKHARSSDEEIAVPAPASRPVVLVPGIWDTRKTMRKMEARLREAGFTAFTAGLTPNNGRLGLDAMAAQLRDQIDAQIPAAERFSIVGFSMGGLISRSYLRQFGDPARLDAFVSISSPHRGTWTAWFRGHPGIRDMRPGSAFLAAIDADAPRYRQARWTTIRTPLDLMILPSRSSVLPWADNQSERVLVHPFMVWDHRVIRRVIAALR
jgi:triacylglycerol lipase